MSDSYAVGIREQRMNNSAFIGANSGTLSYDTFDCVAIGANIELPDGADHVNIIGSGIKIPDGYPTENATYIGGGKDHQIFIQVGAKFYNLGEIIQRLAYAPGGMLYEEAKKELEAS